MEFRWDEYRQCDECHSDVDRRAAQPIGQLLVQISNIYGSTNSAVAILTVTPCDPVPSGIVAWWRGEDNALDSVGGNNGTLMNGTSFTSGEVGTAFSFNGVNNYRSGWQPFTRLDKQDCETDSHLSVGSIPPHVPIRWNFLNTNARWQPSMAQMLAFSLPFIILLPDGSPGSACTRMFWIPIQLGISLLPRRDFDCGTVAARCLNL